MREITVYKYGDPLKGEVYLWKKNNLSFFPRVFIFGGLVGLLLTLSPFIYLEGKYRLNSFSKKEIVQVHPTSAGESFQALAKAPNVQILQPVNTDFSVIIPKIGVNSPVIANINPYDDNQYQKALKEGAAHAAGTYLPGQGGTVYIFAHSTDYLWNVPHFNAIFYLLKEVNSGDEVDIVYQGKRYIYKVTNKVIVSASSISYLRPKGEGEELVLQTCYPPGTTLQRLLVFAKPDKDLSKNL